MVPVSFWIHLCFIWTLSSKETQGLVLFNYTLLYAFFLRTLQMVILTIVLIKQKMSIFYHLEILKGMFLLSLPLKTFTAIT